MTYDKRKLRLSDLPLAQVETNDELLAVHAGQWIRGGKVEDECAVIVQQRSRGPLGWGPPFRMALPPHAVETICSGLQRYAEAAHLDDHAALFGPQE